MKNFVCTTLLSFVILSPVSQAAEKNEKPAAPETTQPQWFISQSDLVLKLPVIAETKPPFTIQISRKYNGAKEEKLLRKAEAAYPAKDTVLASVRNSANPEFLKEVKQSKALWWYSSFDGVRLPYAITSGSVMYYRNLIQQFRKGDFSGSNKIKMISADLKYESEIKHMPQFTLGTHNFENVDVVQMHLSWNQYCGSLCAMGFNRKRTVILESNGNIFVDGDRPESVVAS